MSNTIAENLIRLQNAKENIANAIIEKGGIINPDDGLEDFSQAISSIPTGSYETFQNSITLIIGASSDCPSGEITITT